MNCKPAGGLLDLLVGVVGSGGVVFLCVVRGKPAYGRTVALKGLPWKPFVVSRGDEKDWLQECGSEKFSCSKANAVGYNSLYAWCSPPMPSPNWIAPPH